ncbi:hypothetical protein JDV02_009211 [Purpureocillium takamizusanense]|uniref:Uncharacterized protein n=1 Tax=Purpureocillium takamizusanense TaxID=2060973 RepID=A0A9Q8VFY3_9HYPO|nr:uncharacterized protein JDV02_009211 [Purpureocillium takamizusanense]UNI23389.1 hypothetical protein JDV02_009211 [Purpureocillium takamizusanense]
MTLKYWYFETMAPDVAHTKRRVCPRDATQVPTLWKMTRRVSGALILFFSLALTIGQSEKRGGRGGNFASAPAPQGPGTPWRFIRSRGWPTSSALLPLQLADDQRRWLAQTWLGLSIDGTRSALMRFELTWAAHDARVHSPTGEAPFCRAR